MSRIQTANAAQNVEGVVLLLKDKRDLTVRKIVISSYRFDVTFFQKIVRDRRICRVNFNRCDERRQSSDT